MKRFWIFCSLLFAIACTEGERQTIEQTEETKPVLEKVRELKKRVGKPVHREDSTRLDSLKADSLRQ